MSVGKQKISYKLWKVWLLKYKAPSINRFECLVLEFKFIKILFGFEEMELRKIKEGIFYIPNPVNIGVLQDADDSLILIDTGLDKNTGKMIAGRTEKEVCKKLGMKWIKPEQRER